MALTKATIYQGILIPNAYYKIAWIKVEDYIKTTVVDEVETKSKRWRVEGGWHMYSDNTKVGIISGESFNFDDLNIEQTTIPEVYGLLKTTDKFTNAIDA